MTTIQEIERAIESLSPEEFLALRAWFAALDAQRGVDEVTLLSESALADWNRPEEDAAWSYLQKDK